MEKCFYETYLVGDNIDIGGLSVEKIKEKFLSVTNVINVIIEDIPFM
jgi:hypothetical protein